MPNIEKLIEKLKRNPTELRIDIVKKILRAHHFELENIKGSHYKFSKENHTPIHIPVHHKKIQKWYINDLIKVLYP